MSKVYRIWRNRIRKFLDNPWAVFPFLRKYFYYNFIGDSYIKSYQDFKFLTYDETLEEILTNNKSIVRFGDEVFDMIMGIGLYFNDWRQRYHSALAERLKEVLGSNNPNLLICFNPELILMNKKEFTKQGIPEQHHFWTHSRIYLKEYLKSDGVYGRALSFHDRYNPTLNYELIIDHLKMKHLIIVTSNTKRFNNQKFGLTTDYIDAPKSDAWDSYSDILDNVRMVASQYEKRDVLIMASLGPTAKVLALDLTNEGYTVWDTGQFFDLALKKIL